MNFSKALPNAFQDYITYVETRLRDFREYDWRIHEFRISRNIDLLVPNLTRSRRDLEKRLLKLTDIFQILLFMYKVVNNYYAILYSSDVNLLTIQHK